MAAEKLQLRIIAPDAEKLNETADMVIMRCTTGDMGIMPGHEACSAVLDDGVFRIFNDGEERRMAVFGGIVQVLNNNVTVLANDAQWPEDIDLARSEATREQLERSLRESAGDAALKNDQVRLRRHLVRIEVSSYPLVGKVKPDK